MKPIDATKRLHALENDFQKKCGDDTLTLSDCARRCRPDCTRSALSTGSSSNHTLSPHTSSNDPVPPRVRRERIPGRSTHGVVHNTFRSNAREVETDGPECAACRRTAQRVRSVDWPNRDRRFPQNLWKTLS